MSGGNELGIIINNRIESVHVLLDCKLCAYLTEKV